MADHVGRPRLAHLGRGAARRLPEVLAAGGAGPGGAVPVVLAGRSYSDAQHSRLCRLAGRPLARTAVPPDLDTAGVERLRADLAGVEVLVGVGGGAVMDAAKAVARPGERPYLVLLPMTLSGSEHTAITSWWHQGHKHIRPVGWADAVLADPDLLVDDDAVLGTGALHCVAHALATAAATTATRPVRWAAALAARDLVRGLTGGDRAVLVRGAWVASVAFVSTGPVIGFHHWLVHGHAGPGEHARLSSYLLCRGLLETDVYAPALRRFAEVDAALPDAVRALAAAWLPRIGSLPPRPSHADTAPAAFRDAAVRLAGALP